MQRMAYLDEFCFGDKINFTFFIKPEIGVSPVAAQFQKTRILPELTLVRFGAKGLIQSVIHQIDLSGGRRIGPVADGDQEKAFLKVGEIIVQSVLRQAAP